MDWVKIAAIAVVFGLLVLIPLIAILTEHQRKMAQILRTGTEEGIGMKEDLAALKQDMAELKQALKAYAGEAIEAPKPAQPETLEERLTQR